MHGLIPNSLQGFLISTYGPNAWTQIAGLAAVPDGGFETMLDYPEKAFDAVLSAAQKVLSKDAATILEDMGTFVVSHPDLPALRRLLRFCGASFTDFLNGLEDLRDRASLAVPGLDVPALELSFCGGQLYRIAYRWHRPDGIYVISGILRAMADDYGVLAVTEVLWDESGQPVIEVSLLDRQFAEGREFDLGARA